MAWCNVVEAKYSSVQIEIFWNNSRIQWEKNYQSKVDNIKLGTLTRQRNSKIVLFEVLIQKFPCLIVMAYARRMKRFNSVCFYPFCKTTNYCYDLVFSKTTKVKV